MSNIIKDSFISSENLTKSRQSNSTLSSRSYNKSKNFNINSESDDDIAPVKKTTANKSKNFNIDSESDDDIVPVKKTNKKINVIDSSDDEEQNVSQKSFSKYRNHDSESSTNSEISPSRKSKTKLNNSEGIDNENIENSDSEDASLHSIYQSSSDEDIKEKLNASKIVEEVNDPTFSRLSAEFHFGNRKSILNSTAVFEGRIVNTSLSTPRQVKPIIPSRSPSPDATESDEDIIEISSEEMEIPRSPKKPFVNKTIKQTTLDSIIVKKPKENEPTVKSKINLDSPLLNVSPNQFQVQLAKVKNLESDLAKSKNMIRTIKLDLLPDKGELLHKRQTNLEQALLQEQKKLNNMTITTAVSLANEAPLALKLKNQVVATWEDIQAGAGAVQPKTFGKQAMSTYNAQKALTLDRLQQLHGSMETCPTEDTLAEDPKGLKVVLMPHQKRALAWVMWREKQKPSGGILADDMGLGKTLTMISLMLKTNEMKQKENLDDSQDENRPERSSYKYPGGTLIVCPASLLNQWSGELVRRTKRGLASYELYHGTKRETKAKRLASHDMVITTYAIINNECERKGTVFRVKWRRIILDEAHQIRNHKSQTSVAVCQLAANSRWALTGTPIQNKELDMYALLKFLRCSPFDDLQVWKRWVGDKSTGGQGRLHTVISSLMLRRTKAELMEKGALNCMLERKWELIPIELQKNELDVYQKILIFSRTLFAQFLHQRAEKNQDVLDSDQFSSKNAPNAEYFKMRAGLLKLNKVKDVSQHEILVLLLRLRQICCHPSLIKPMLIDKSEDTSGAEDDESIEELNLLEQLNNLNIEEANNSVEGISAANVGLKEASKGFLNPSNPVFSKDHQSSKIGVMLKVLRERVLHTNDKAIIVSQWPSYLNIIGLHLRDEGVEFGQLDGSIPVHKRMGLVDDFNDPNHKMKILLLSLTAGGVGLNLVGANHLFLLDLHWNPQLENQAQDRIYRVGQEKPVFVYKFMASNTIEERIRALQEKKLGLADSMLTGSKQAINTKLSLQDLRMLFEM